MRLFLDCVITCCLKNQIVLETPILSAVSLIGVTTFCISVAGVAVGCWFGARYKRRAEITGGVILVLLGCKILLEHLGLLSF